MTKKVLSTLFAVLILAFTLLTGLAISNSYVFASESATINITSAELVGGNGLKEFQSGDKKTFGALVNQEIKLYANASFDVQNISIQLESGVICTADLVCDEHSMTATLVAQKSGKFNIAFVGDCDGKVVFDVICLDVRDGVEQIEIIPSNKYVSFVGQTEFSLVYNGLNEVETTEIVCLDLYCGDKKFVIVSADYSNVEQVKEFTSKKIVIDFGGFDFAFSKCRMVASIGKVKGSLSFDVENLTLPTEVVLQNKTATLYTESTTAQLYLYMTKNSLPYIDVVDSENEIKLLDYSKIESDLKDFDKIVVTLSIADVSNIDSLLFVVKGKNGNIYKAMQIGIINKIESVELDKKGGVLDNKESVLIKAKVNGFDDYSSACEWYVNGKKVENENAVFEFVSNGGNSTIYAKIGDVSSEQIVFTVKYSVGKMWFWYILLALCIVGVIVLVLTRKKKGKINPFGTLTENIDEVVDGVKELKTNFKWRLARRTMKNFAIIKERCYFNYMENGEHLYAEANKALQTGYKLMRRLFVKKLKKEQRDELFDKVLAQLNIAFDALLEFNRLCSKTTE